MSVTVCRQVQSGVQAIFGPADAIISEHIQSICDALDIPHIQMRVDLEPTIDNAVSYASFINPEAMVNLSNNRYVYAGKKLHHIIH